MEKKRLGRQTGIPNSAPAGDVLDLHVKLQRQKVITFQAACYANGKSMKAVIDELVSQYLQQVAAVYGAEQETK